MKLKLLLLIFIVVGMTGCGHKKKIADLFNQAMQAQNDKNYDLEIAKLNLILQLDPQNTNAYKLCGVIYGMRGWDLNEKGNYAGAISSFNMAIQIDPFDAKAYSIRGYAYAKKENFEQALTDCNKAINIDPTNAQFYVVRAGVYGFIKNFDKMIADCNKAIKLDSNNSAAYQGLGAAYYSKGDFTNSISNYKEAIRLDPKNINIYESLGDAYGKIGFFKEAIKNYSKFIEFTQNNEDILEVFYERGVVYEKTGEFDKAANDFDEAVTTVPQDQKIYNTYAWLLATCPDDSVRDGKKAIQMALTACKLSEFGDWRYLDTLAAAYAENQSFDEAVHYQKLAISFEAIQGVGDQAGLNKRLDLYLHKTPYRETSW